MSRFRRVCVAMARLVCPAISCAAVAQPACEGYWTSTGIPVPAQTNAVIAFDDGNGSTLYAASDSLVRKWTGQSWIALSTNGFGPNFRSLTQLRTVGTPTGKRLMVLARRVVTAGENPYEPFGDFEAVPMVFVTDHWEPVVAHHLFVNVVSLRYVDLGDGPAYYGVTYVYDRFGNILRNLVRRWTGTGWDNFGETDAGGNTTISVHDFGQGRALYVWSQGDSGFSHVNGIQALGFAKWDGHQWSSPWPERVVSGDSELFVEISENDRPVLYGFFYPEINGVQSKGVGRYDGLGFRDIGGAELGPGQVGDMVSLAVMDAGFGPNLFMGGGFPKLTGGIASPGIGRWDGHSWYAVGAGVSSAFSSDLAVIQSSHGPRMYMRIPGSNGFGGGVAPPNTLALYVGCPNCYANCDLSVKSPSLTANDFMCFMNKFLARDPYANCTVDATIDITDFQCFISKFAAGCP